MDPPTVAVIDGRLKIGLSDAEREALAKVEGAMKLSRADLAFAVAEKRTGGTTVAATMIAAALAGVKVFATGGIGGVHKEPAFDESADLMELARTPAIVVCSGAKSILDLPATVERLETLAIPVIGFQTREFPAFFSANSGLPVTATADSVEEIVRIARAHRGLGRREAILVVQPPPQDAALEANEVDRAITQALEEARARGIRGPATTPFLLGAVERSTEGRSLRANLALLEANAELAARIAVAFHKARSERE